MHNNRLKIGIIGGGAAGLMAAWLLEADHDVILFEEQDRLGGHVDTILVPLDGKDIAIDAGFEFFSEPLFPQLCQLLALLNVEMRAYPLTYTFYNQHEQYVLPPFTHKRVNFKTLTPSKLFTLAQFNYLLHAGKKIVNSRDTTITVQAFAENSGVTHSFAENFLYPFYAGAWGTEIEYLKEFAAYDVLAWSLKNKPAGLFPGTWLEVVGGTKRYIDALVSELSNTAQMRIDQTITGLTFNEKGYGIITNDSIVYFDHLIIATNATQAQKLLHTIPHAEDHKTALSKIDYFNALIAVHGDERWMPKDKRDWSVANIRYDGRKSQLTIFKQLLDNNKSLFRSWIMYKEHEIRYPEPLYALREYSHVKVNINYFDAQKILKKLQGENNLWIAGLYMHDIDSHNSALESAITIAKILAPRSKRLSHFLK